MLNRRKFTKVGIIASLGLGIIPGSAAKTSSSKKPILDSLFNSITKKEMKEFLSGILYTRQEVDDYFADKAFPFSKHSQEFGWLLRDARFRDGANNSISVYNFKKPDGERKMSNYADHPCRINTYGNSFTQCHQVSDHETWQEVLSAHIQEPVKNFGVGGWSVYQAYLRMLKEEKRTSAEYIIFNIYDDDHYRSLDAWRNIRKSKHAQFIEPPLPHVKVDLKNRTITEHQNPTPTKEDYYKLCDIDSSYELFKDDLSAKVRIAHNKSKDRNENLSYKDIQALTKTHGIETSLDTNATLSKIVSAYHRECALFSSEKIVEKIEQFAKEKGKKVLYVLSYPAGYLAQAHDLGSRWDQPFIDFLIKKELPFVDLGHAHFEEFKQFNIDLKTYLQRYFIGHYNPLGNMFCTDQIRAQLVSMMEPKPLSYSEEVKLGSI